MSEQKCPVDDRRVNVCPLAEKIACAAADKAVSDVFAKLGYDVEDPDDLKKLIVLFDFLETTTRNVGKGKVIVMTTVLASIVLGTIGAVVAKFYKGV